MKTPQLLAAALVGALAWGLTVGPAACAAVDRFQGQSIGLNFAIKF